MKDRFGESVSPAENLRRIYNDSSRLQYQLEQLTRENIKAVEDKLEKVGSLIHLHQGGEFKEIISHSSVISRIDGLKGADLLSFDYKFFPVGVVVNGEREGIFSFKDRIGLFIAPSTYRPTIGIESPSGCSVSINWQRDDMLVNFSSSLPPLEMDLTQPILLYHRNPLADFNQGKDDFFKVLALSEIVQWIEKTVDSKIDKARKTA